MPTWIVGAALGCYAAALFVVAWWAHQRIARPVLGTSVVTALSFGVYCTSWTFYGAVGTAVRSGWDYLPIYLGPMLAFTLGLGLVTRIVALGKGHGAISLSDLLSRRFGRSAPLASLITLTIFFVSIPYIALQLIAVATTFAEVTGHAGTISPTLVLSIALVFGLFGALFGIRNKDVTRQNPGLVGAIAFDSLFKFLAFIAVAVLALSALGDASPSARQIVPATGFSLDRFLVLTGLAFFASVLLPRQFQMMVVEAKSTEHVRRAAPLIVLYLAGFSILALPIAVAGQVLSPGTSPDLYVLAVPQAFGMEALTLLAFVGGFAAAAGMIIVAGVALSTMVTVDLVLPLLSRSEAAFRQVLFIRRLTLCILLLVAAGFALAASEEGGLASFGIVAFAGIGQLIPLLLAGLFISRVSEAGAVFGLITGVSAWVFFTLGPSLFAGSPIDWSAVPASILPFVSDGFSSGVLLSLVLNTFAMISASLIWPSSLKLREDTARFNAIIPRGPERGTVSIGDLQTLLVQIIGQAETQALLSVFGNLAKEDVAPTGLLSAAETKLSGVLGNASANILLTRLLARGEVGAGDVMILMGNASRELRLGQELLGATLDNLAEGVSVIDGEGRLSAWNKAYNDLFSYPDGFLHVGLPVEALFRHNLPNLTDREIEQRKQQLLSGRPYTSETRLRDGRIIKLQGRPVPDGGYVTSFSDVSEYREAQSALKDSAAAIRFYTDNVPFPIGFSDQDEVLRFHNKAFANMVGRPNEDLTGQELKEVFADQYRHRVVAIRSVLSGKSTRFALGPENLGGSITWQVTYVPQLDPNGTVTGFFGFYQDISKRREAQAALEDANRYLEARVSQRTAALHEANLALEDARQRAEEANNSKTRFLAAASHDVLQPLNAARLFASSLEDGLPTDGAERQVAQKIGAAIVSADTLLRSLLNLSKLDAGGVDPKPETFHLGPYLDGIVSEFLPLAEDKGLRLSTVPTKAVSRSDPGLLRSALQNLLSNALRYTDEGGVVIGVRRYSGQWAIDIADTGRGISEDEVPQIFEEFARLKRDRDIEGAGLGLATVRRVTDLLGHEIVVSSNVGRGTVFRLLLPRVERHEALSAKPCSAASTLTGAKIVCVDNDHAVLDALKTRFEAWGAEPEAFLALDGVRKAYRNGAALPDLLVLDYQLDEGTTGLDVLDFMRTEKNATCPAIIVTATSLHDIGASLEGRGLSVLTKPVEPAALRALSISLLSAQKA